MRRGFDSTLFGVRSCNQTIDRFWGSDSLLRPVGWGRIARTLPSLSAQSGRRQERSTHTFLKGDSPKARQKTQHHPDIDIRFNKVSLNLTTHDECGLTQKDFFMVRQSDEA